MGNFFKPSILKNKEEKKKHRRQVAASIFILYLICSIANVPFSREIRRLGLESGELLSEPIFDYAFTIGIGASTGAIIIFIGLWVSASSNLGAPVFTGLFSKQPISELINWRSFLSSVALAVLAAIILLGLFELLNYVHPVAAIQERPSKLYYLLVSFVMGVNEEIIYRLGLMSLIVTVLQYFKKIEEPNNNMVWTGIIITALLFGMMHFPITSNFFELTPFTISVTIIGNLITGSIFGWIFWKRGLLVAIVAHIAFDITFHVIGSPFG